VALESRGHGGAGAQVDEVVRREHPAWAVRLNASQDLRVDGFAVFAHFCHEN
jgi:hypothetical protein